MCLVLLCSDYNDGEMVKKLQAHAADLRGVNRLAIDGIAGVIDLVEAMHDNIASVPGILRGRKPGRTTGITGLVYRSIRGVLGGVGHGLDRALAQLELLLMARVGPLAGEQRRPGRDALLAALNGVLGDYLAASNNPLAITMRLRWRGVALPDHREALAAAIPQAGGRLVVLLHGLCMNDRLWKRKGHDHGAALARDLAYTPVYLHYNSGLHVSTNGRAFADLLEALVKIWPVPLTELVLVGHSMGGLVARSACHYGALAGHDWRRRLDKLVFVGTPHHGAPLERGGNWVDVLLGVSRYSAQLSRLGRIRSAGVTDMRYGNVEDEHWDGRDRFAPVGDTRSLLKLPDGVQCYAIAATLSPKEGGKLRTDGLVPVDSALGRHDKPELTLAIPETHQSIAFGVGHLELLDRPEVYDKLRAWL